MHVLQPEEEIDPLDPHERHTFEEKKDYFQKIGERESQSLWIKKWFGKESWPIDWISKNSKASMYVYIYYIYIYIKKIKQVDKLHLVTSAWLP